MEGHGRHTTVCVAELLVRAPLSNLGEAEGLKNGDDLPWLQDGDVTHVRRP